MKSICYIVPYFGKLPDNFDLWLLGCKMNPTIDWVVYTDDHTPYDYPHNVKVKYCTYQEIKDRIQSLYDFKVDLGRPWRLALMKSAYGEIFSDDLKGYDFWGYCDVDLMWGDIRKFYTDDVLSKYTRIGFQGHSTLFPNTPECCKLYRTIIPDHINYIDVFSGKRDFSWDESGMNMVCHYLDIPEYREVNFAHLDKYEKGFFLKHRPKEDEPNNKYQVFTWEKGRLVRHYLKNGEIKHEEMIYIHFWCRPIKYRVKHVSENATYYIYPDVFSDKSMSINPRSVRKYGSRSYIGFVLEMLWRNRKKISFKRIMENLESRKRSMAKRTNNK